MLVRDINPLGGSGVHELTNVNGTLFFFAFDEANGDALWKSDGTEVGTVLVKDINPFDLFSSLSNLTNVNGTLFFSADDRVNGTELWKSDGTEAGTVLVRDIACPPTDVVQFVLATWKEQGGGLGKLNVTATSSDPTAFLILFEIPAADGTCPLDAPITGGICNWGPGFTNPKTPGTYIWKNLHDAPQPQSLFIVSDKGGSAQVPCGQLDNKGRLTCP